MLTELHYHPASSNGLDDDPIEFLELQNTGTAVVDLTGLVFTQGIAFAFTNGATLGPGAYVVLAQDAFQLAARFPGIEVHGQYSGRLDNAGEGLTLGYPGASTVFELTYDDERPWPVLADGGGMSLQRANALPDFADARNWCAAPPHPARLFRRLAVTATAMACRIIRNSHTRWILPTPPMPSRMPTAMGWTTARNSRPARTRGTHRVRCDSSVSAWAPRRPVSCWRSWRARTWRAGGSQQHARRRRVDRDRLCASSAGRPPDLRHQSRRGRRPVLSAGRVAAVADERGCASDWRGVLPDRSRGSQSGRRLPQSKTLRAVRRRPKRRQSRGCAYAST